MYSPLRPVIFAVFASLLIVLGLTYPISFGPTSRYDARSAEALSLPRCYQLAYADSTIAPHPSQILLSPDTAHSGLHAAAGSVHEGFLPEVFWLPSSQDSLDVWLHYHGPVIRLPIEGDSVRGRLALAGSAPLLQLLFNPPRDIPIQAVRVTCIPSAAT
jgi:hypothetical protein